MSAEDQRPQPAGTPAVVVSACTACQLVYQPSAADFANGATGCRRCGGWTWIAQLGAGETGGDQSWK